MKHNLIDKLAFIDCKDHTVLMTRSKGKDTWYIPGGKREAEESDHDALIREIREELSVELLPESLKKYGVFEAQAHGKPEGVIVRMSCYTGDFKGKLKASMEIAEWDYFDYSQKEDTGPVDQLIFEDLHIKGLIK